MDVKRLEELARRCRETVQGAGLIGIQLTVDDIADLARCAAEVLRAEWEKERKG